MKAIDSYNTFKSGGKVTVGMYLNTLKYLLITTKSKDVMPSYKKKKEIVNRIMITDNLEEEFIKLKT